MGNDTRRMDRPDKTIGPESTPGVQQPREFVLSSDAETFAPVPGTDVIPQALLAALAADEEHRAFLDSQIERARIEIVRRLRAGGVVAPGEWAVSVRTNMKPQSVKWKEAFIGALGKVEADAVEAAAKSGPREVSSYTLDMKRVGG